MLPIRQIFLNPKAARGHPFSLMADVTPYNSWAHDSSHDFKDLLNRGRISRSCGLLIIFPTKTLILDLCFLPWMTCGLHFFPQTLVSPSAIFVSSLPSLTSFFIPLDCVQSTNKAGLPCVTQGKGQDFIWLLGWTKSGGSSSPFWFCQVAPGKSLLPEGDISICFPGFLSIRPLIVAWEQFGSHETIAPAQGARLIIRGDLACKSPLFLEGVEQ